MVKILGTIEGKGVTDYIAIGKATVVDTTRPVFYDPENAIYEIDRMIDIASPEKTRLFAQPGYGPIKSRYISNPDQGPMMLPKIRVRPSN